MRKIVLTFGLIAGCIMGLMFVISLPFHDKLGNDGGMLLGYATMVAAFMLIFFGIKAYRDNVAGGLVSFGRAFAIGALITAVASVIYVATWEVVYFGGFAPDYIEKYQARAIEEERASGATQAELDAKRAELERFAEYYRNPVLNAAFTFLEPLPVGLIIALISAGVLRRKFA